MCSRLVVIENNSKLSSVMLGIFCTINNHCVIGTVLDCLLSTVTEERPAKKHYDKLSLKKMSFKEIKKTFRTFL